MQKKKVKKEKTHDDADEIVFEEETEGGGAGAMKKLRERLKKCTEEKQEYLDGWQRSKADFVNLKKEHEKRMGDMKKFASEDLVQDLLPVVESFDMAFANKEAWQAVDENWRRGVEYIHTQFMAALESNGMKQIGAAGEAFDHNIHESVGVVDTEEEAQDGSVAEVVRSGYELSGKVIRPAKVKVFNYKK